MIIGICGKSGSGKSTLSKNLIKYFNKSVVHLDIDKIGHKVLTLPDIKIELVNSFGKSIMIGNDIDRKKIGDIVFNLRNEMKRLSDITWDYMQVEIDKFIDENENNIIILDWILLPISKYFDKCNVKILLDIPYEVRKERVIKRDNISSDLFDLREKASIDFKIQKFDFVIKENNMEIIKKLVKIL